MCVMKMQKVILIVLVIAIVLLVIGFVLGNNMNDFLRGIIATVVGILIAVLLAWFLFEKRASILLNRVNKILEKNEQYQQSVKKSWAENNLVPIAAHLLEVTRRILDDLQGIEDDVCIGREEDISLEAQKVLGKADDLFGPNKDSFIKINSEAATSLTQSSKLLERLEAYLKVGPDWIKDDPRIARFLQEAITCMENIPTDLFVYSNVKPMARRVRVVPGSFENIVGEVWGTSLWTYIREVGNLTIAIDEKVNKE